GIGLALAPITSIAAFDIFSAELRIAVRTVATVALRTVTARRPALVALLRAIRSLGTLIGPRRAIGTLLGPIATLPITTVTAINTVMATMPTVMLAPTALARLSTAFWRRRRRSGGGALRRGRRLAAAMRMLRALRPALLPLMASTGAPNLHEIRLRRL